MTRKISGKVRTSQFRRTQKNGDVYVYERTLQYNPEKAIQNRSRAGFWGKYLLEGQK